MVEVIINGVSVDLRSKGVKYTKQANDLADISTVNTSFTYSLQADKTPKNTRLFQQLGMIGDTSEFPYIINKAQLIENGTVLIEKGIPTVKDTNDVYDLFIQDGIINFFKEIENKTLGLDLDLSEVNHDKNIANVIGSWTSDLPYRYFIADYNGKTEDENGIDISYQIPSISMRYIWNKILRYSGYAYSGDFDFLNDKWLTYPKPPEIEETNIIEHLDVESNVYESTSPSEAYKSWKSPTTLDGVSLINGWKILINTSGVYTITYSGSGELLLDEERAEPEEFGIDLMINGVRSSYSFSDAAAPKKVILDVKAGDLIELIIPEIDFNSNRIDYVGVTYLRLNITSSSRETINFTDVLADFSIRDFVKEVIIRGALTPYTDNINKHIHFDSLKERLDTKNYEDISSFYVSRTNESYTFDKYAQKNKFKLKYDASEDSYFDGAIYVRNANTKPEDDLFVSKFYAVAQYESPFLLELGRTDRLVSLKLWEKNIKETGATQEIDYKALNNRFYLISSNYINDTISLNGQTVSGFYKASSKGTSMQDTINSKWSSVNKIFIDTRIHEIDLALTCYQFKAMDLRKVKYIAQEGQFYILNKVVWESGKISKGEFLRVKKI